MSRPDSEPRKINILNKKTASIANAVLLVGSVAAAAIGGQRAISEYGKDNQSKGAITRSLELSEPGRPSQAELVEAREFVKGLVSDVDQNSNDQDLFVVSQNILEAENKLKVHYVTLSNESTFQEVKKTFIHEIGADDLDDANLWTVAAGTTATLIALSIAYKTKDNSRKKTKPQDL